MYDVTRFGDENNLRLLGALLGRYPGGQGHRALFHLPSKRTWYFAHIEDWVTKLFELTACAQPGDGVYHACAIYAEPRRIARCAAGAFAFWLDIDSGPGKPYADQVAAAESVKLFCERVRIPYPTIVNSGSGLHVYWLTEEFINPELWLRHARGLKLLCEQHQLACDPKRTTDLASVLRPPGSFNLKRGTEPVDVVHFVEPLPLGELQAFQVAFEGCELPKEPRAPTKTVRKYANEQVAYNDKINVWNHLLKIDPSHYEHWLLCGMALYDVSGDWPEAKAMWDVWSAQAPNHNEKITNDAQWAQFAKRDNTYRGQRVTLGTLIHLSRKLQGFNQ